MCDCNTFSCANCTPGRTVLQTIPELAAQCVKDGSAIHGPDVRLDLSLELFINGEPVWCASLVDLASGKTIEDAESYDPVDALKRLALELEP